MAAGHTKSEGINMFEKLFSPITIRGLTLESRAVMTAMGTRFTDNKHANQKHIAYHVARAKGGCTLNIIECTGVHDGSDACMMLSLARDEYVPDMKKLVDAIHEAGGKAGIQLYQGGLGVCYDSDALMLVPDAIDYDTMEDVRISFGKAAARAVECGADLIEVHCAHQYLLHSFLSPCFNHRTDEYGGSFENRMKYPLACLEEVRKNMPDDMPLSIRASIQDDYLEGLTVDDCITFCKKAKVIGVDMLNLSRGNMITTANRFEVPPIDLPHGFNLENSARIRKETGMVTMCVGRINNPYYAEEILEKDLVDLVAMSRAQIADPEFMNKCREGRVDDIDFCVGCNEGCLDGFANLEMPHITCLRNPAVGRESEIDMSIVREPKTVLIAGGGMAGLMAAKTLKKRGHNPILCEKTEKLGGQFILAGSTPRKEEMKKAAEAMAEQVTRMGVDVRLNTELTPELISEIMPYAVFNCMGSTPSVPPINGIDRDNIVCSHDVISGKVKVSGKIVVIGGGMVGIETAELLATGGCDVTVLEMNVAVAIDLGSARKYCVLDYIKEEGIKTITSATVKEITSTSVIAEKDGEIIEVPYDFVVTATGSTPVDDTAIRQTCDAKGIVYRAVGDAKEVRRALEANREAFDAALEI